MTETKSLWRVTGCDWIDTDPAVDVIAVAVTGYGKTFAVTCAGPKGMNSTDFTTAMRAAVAGLLLSAGGDLKAVGAETLEESKFDTGNQRVS